MLPPLFKKTRDRVGNGVWVYTDWKSALFATENSSDRIIAMLAEDPRLYEWPVKGLEVLCMSHDETLVQTLLEHQAAVVRTIDKDGNLRIYRCP